jgi:co-chaperonin GroES (HSP10)
MISPATDHILITIEKEYENMLVLNSGLELKFVTDYEPERNRRIFGTVVAVPQKLTQKQLKQEMPGLPEPARYIDHEIVSKVGVELIQYQCGIYEPTWKTIADIPQDVQVGDKIYFHFNTLVPENKIKLKDGRNLYKLNYTNALCVVRSSEIIGVSGHVLIEPVYEDGTIDLGNNIKGKVNEFNLVTDLHTKAKYLEGIVRHVCKPLHGDELDLHPGERIFFVENSDWEVKIEDKIFYCMKYWDIIAKIEHDGN